MNDILNEANAIAQCKECPWYKSCAMPLRFTVEDIRRQMETQAPGMDMNQPADVNMQNMMAGMATAAQNSLLEGCPIFIERLRSNPRLVQRLKEMMQHWGTESDTG
ncbi:hypothetical protein ACFLYF_03435 [Chloroflexota bacterium]